MGQKVSFNANNLNLQNLLEKYQWLHFDESLYFENILTYSKWSVMEHLKLYQQPLDRNRWDINPQNTNAYYKMSTNEIVLPMGILQPPFFSFSNPN